MEEEDLRNNRIGMITHAVRLIELSKRKCADETHENHHDPRKRSESEEEKRPG